MWLYFLSAEPDATTGIHSVMGSKYRLYWYVPYDAISRLKPIIIINFICSCSNLSTLASLNFRLWTCSIVAGPLQTYTVRQQEVRQPSQTTGSQATGCLHKIIIRLQIIHTVTVLPEFWLHLHNEHSTQRVIASADASCSPQWYCTTHEEGMSFSMQNWMEDALHRCQQGEPLVVTGARGSREESVSGIRTVVEDQAVDVATPWNTTGLCMVNYAFALVCLQTTINMD